MFNTLSQDPLLTNSLWLAEKVYMTPMESYGARYMESHFYSQYRNLSQECSVDDLRLHLERYHPEASDGFKFAVMEYFIKNPEVKIFFEVLLEVTVIDVPASRLSALQGLGGVTGRFVALKEGDLRQSLRLGMMLLKLHTKTVRELKRRAQPFLDRWGDG